MDLTGKHYTWFQNRECEYFPCHKGVREEEFNCLFCYCPLYRHPNCRGSFVLRDGIKDCSYCLLPHNGLESYAYIQAKLMEPARLEPQGEPNRRPAAAGPRPSAAGEPAPKNPPTVSPGMGKARRSEHSSGLVCCVSRFQWLGFDKIAKKRASCSLKRTERGTAGKRR